MQPSTCASSDGGLDSLFMSLAISPEGKTLKTGLFRRSWDEAAKIMQRGIAHSNLKLFVRGFEALVNRVLYGFEEGEETESKFLRGFEAREEGRRNEEVGENIMSWHEIKEEETYELDLEDIRGWVMYDEEDEDFVGEEDLGDIIGEWVDVVEEEKYEGEVEEGWVVTDGEDEDLVDKDSGWVIYEGEDDDSVEEKTYEVDLREIPGWIVRDEELEA